MAAGNIYELVVRMEKTGQEFLSIYHYLHVTGTGDADDLLPDFVTNVVPALQNLLSTSVVIDDLFCVNLDDLSDFSVNGGDFAGNVTGENMPPQVTYSLRMQTNRLDAKDGGKHLPGVIESYINNGDIVGGIPQIRLSTVMAAVEAPLNPAGNYWRACVYGKRRGSLGTFGNILSAVSWRGAQTQNTRKVYI